MPQLNLTIEEHQALSNLVTMETNPNGRIWAVIRNTTT